MVEPLQIAGTYLERELVNDPRCPPDELFRWHFRQAVLTNMRGAGEPIFDFDFPPGTDMIGEICNGPKPAERMEVELFSRLALLDVNNKASRRELVTQGGQETKGKGAASHENQKSNVSATHLGLD